MLVKKMLILLGFVVVLSLFSPTGFAQGEGTPEEDVCSEKKTSEETPACLREQRIKDRVKKLLDQEKEKRQEKLARSKETPVEKKAREEIEKEEKSTAKAEKRMNKAYSRAGVSCPGGDEEKVDIVNPRAFEYPWGIGAIVTVVNKKNVPVDISIPGYGTVVKHLCGHGQISLTVLSDWAGPDNFSVPLTASGPLDDGRLGTSVYFVYLNRRNPYQDTTKPLIWQVYLDQ